MKRAGSSQRAVVGLVVVVAGRASASPFEFRDPMSGSVAKLTVGRVIHKDAMLEVTLSDRDPGCAPPSGPPHNPRFIFSLPAGPGGTFYAGAKVGVSSFMVTADGTGMGLGAEGTAITLAPFKLAAGAHVTGTIDALYGKGAFDAIVCPGVDAAKLRALPTSARPTPFAGKIRGTPFAVKSAVALFERQSDTFTLVRSVRLYADTGVTCKTKDAATGAAVYLSDIGGASTTARLSGSPQPATAAVRGKTEASYDRDAVWVQLDKLTLVAGGSIAGRAVIDAADGTSLAGSFTAVGCGP